MAFLSSGYQQEKSQLKQDGSAAPLSSPGSSASLNPAGSASAQSTMGQQPGQAPASQGTGFVNAQSFLNANQAGASQLGQGLTSYVEGEARDARAAQRGNAQASGTGDASSAPGYTDAAQKTAAATWDGQALTNNQERPAVLHAVYGQNGGYTGGETAWDNMLATQGQGNAGLFLGAQADTQGLQGGLGKGGGAPPPPMAGKGSPTHSPVYIQPPAQADAAASADGRGTFAGDTYGNRHPTLPRRPSGY